MLLLVMFALPGFAAEEREPSGIDVKLAEITSALRAGRIEAGLQLVEEAESAWANNPQILLRKAALLEAKEDWDAALNVYNTLLEREPDSAKVWQYRGVLHFRMGQAEASVKDFSRYLQLSPGQEPYHWQRGISQYYAGDYENGAKQFKLHQKVNGTDVENAVWHFLCVARSHSVEQARKRMYPYAGDPRVPMKEIHALFAGTGTEEEVLEAARGGEPSDRVLKNRLCYAHLYLGLFQEALGNLEKAKEHMRLAAEKYSQPHYMGLVANVHLKLRGWKSEEEQEEGSL